MTETLTTTPPGPPEPRPSGARRALTGAGLAVLVASAVFGANPFGFRDRVLDAVPEERPAAVGRSLDGAVPAPLLSETTIPRTALRSQPWWQGLTTVEGSGPTTLPAFTVATGAIQWRVTWRCQTGRLSVQAQGSSRPIVSGQCPAEDVGYATRTGPVTLQVTADGPWKLTVEQQIDLPLNEPPLPAMTAPGAAKVSGGDFYRIDQFGEGKVSITRLPNGTYALRLDNFYVTPNTDLTIELNPLPAPRTTEQARSVPVVEVAPLDVTAGSMNFILPASVNPRDYKSVVIWCERLFSAYAAATLTGA